MFAKEKDQPEHVLCSVVFVLPFQLSRKEKAVSEREETHPSGLLNVIC